MSHESTATAVSLAAIAIGSAMAILASVAGLLTMVLRYCQGRKRGPWCG